jgi:hypothetical protein
MRLRSCSLRVLSLTASVALVAVACAPNNPEPSSQDAISTEPSVTSCGITLCDSTPGSSTPTTTIGPTVPWVAATANLAGLPSECGNMSLLSARPDRDMLIAGVARQGLWASQNGSATWTRLGQGIGSAAISNRPSSITYDPSHPDTFWESGLYNGPGLYETMDNGASFKQLGNLIHSDFVSVDLSDPARRTLLSGRHETSNLYRSGDGGATWVDLTSTLPAGIGHTKAPLVLDARVHLLGTAQAPGSGIFRTIDGGSTWSRVFQGGVSGPALVAKSDGAIYWLLEQGNGLVKSTDRGLTWQRVLGPGRISDNSGSLLELPDGRLATFSRFVIVSADHGATWQSVGSGLPYTPTGIVYSAYRKAFYAWRYDCAFSGDTSVKADAIMRMAFDYKTP